jgi:hypothetical protein
MKKISLLAASVAFALMGCGGSDGDSNHNSNDGSTGTDTTKAQKPSIAVPTKGKFIDAKVIGLDYVSGSTSGQTDATGGYTIDPSNPEVSFYLGGQYGLFVGSVSGRHITTPFEAAGTHQRAVNLARLLLTIGEGTSTLINSGQAELITAITLPTDFSAAADKLKIAMLDNEDSLQEIATALGKGPLVTEKDATTHMEASLANIERGSAVNLSHWSRGSNWTFVERSSSLLETAGNDPEVLSSVIHLDTTNEAAQFDETSSMILTLNQDNPIIRTGSNDTSMSGSDAAEYLTCMKTGGEYSEREVEGEKYKVGFCDEDRIVNIHSDYQHYSDYNQHYQYDFTNPTTIKTADESMPWADLAEMGGAFECMAASNCSEQSLSKFETVIRDDNTDGYYGDDPKWQKEVLSGSYDPITDVYTQSRRKIDLEPVAENGTIEPEDAETYEYAHISESIVFLYPVEAPGQDRYVDFIGTWEARELCGNDVAIAKMTFTTAGLTMTGEECNRIDSVETISNMETETYAYKDLPKDLWWFGTNAAGDSKATLDQLNSTVRWNDREPEDDADSIKINRFTYIPAGVNWDKGLLIRDTLDSNGDKLSTITMKKI